MLPEEYRNIYDHESTHWWYRTLHHLVEMIVKESIKKQFGNKPVKILDAGCGTGRMMEILRKYGEVDGIDYSPEAISFVKKRGFHQAEITDLNEWIPRKRYDIIVSLDVLYHTGIRDDMTVVRKFHDALHQEGILILNLPAFEILRRRHDLVVHTRRRYTRSIFTDQLTKSGFKPEIAGYRLPILYFAILAAKLFSSLHPAREVKSDLKDVPLLLNKLLYFAGRLENRWIYQAGGFPAGSSLFVVAKKV
jgi:predicted TPR repeat methyltransferase